MFIANKKSFNALQLWNIKIYQNLSHHDSNIFYLNFSLKIISCNIELFLIRFIVYESMNLTADIHSNLVIEKMVTYSKNESKNNLDEKSNGKQDCGTSKLAIKRSLSIFMKKASFLFKFNNKKAGEAISNEDNELLKKKLQLMNIDSIKKRLSKIPVRKSTVTAHTTRLALKIKSLPNYLWIIFFVKKFTNILKASVLLKQLIKLKPYHYNLIKDNTYFDISYKYIYNIIRFNNPLYQDENNSIFHKIILFKNYVNIQIQEIQAVIRKIEVFQPDRSFIIFWNFIMLFFVLMNAFYIPLKLGFNLDFEAINDVIYIFVETCSVWIFIIDIFININTSYYAKGVYIVERFKIIKHYIKYSFLLDFFSIVPVLLAYFTSIPYVEIFFLLRIFKLKKSVKKVEDFLQIRDLQGGIMELTKLFFFIVYFSHFCCCGFHYLGIYEIERGDQWTWLDFCKIRNSSWMVKYVHSLYYAVVTMVTVGYGDIVPQTVPEKMFAVMYIILACGVFAYSVNEIGSILRDMYKDENEFKYQNLKIHNFLFYLEQRLIK